MRTRIMKAALVAVLCALAAAPWMSARAGNSSDRVLVLGFQSNALDDIQDRCFRETLIREFHDRGFAVVPVMEIESVLQTERPPDIRNVGAELAASLCAELGAGYAVCGKITRVEKKEKDSADEYACEAAVFFMKDQSFWRTTVSGVMSDGMDRMFAGLAAEIVARIGGRIRPGKRA